MKTDIEKRIEKAKAGDEKAFSALYQETKQRNYYIVLKMTGNEADTQDILQDTYVKVYTHLKDFQYEGPESFAAWTSKIANNTALSFLRRKKPELFSELEREDEDENISLQWEDLSPDYKPEVAFDRKETARIVHELLQSLSEEQRVCVLMFYLQEMSIKEIAQQCQCSENTVKSRLNYARKNIQKQEEVLKKKGINLYNVAPFPLLLYLLRQEVPKKMAKRSIFAGLSMIQILAGTVIVLTSVGVGAGMLIGSQKPAELPVMPTVPPVTTEEPLVEVTPQPTHEALEEVEVTPQPTKKPIKTKGKKSKKPKLTQKPKVIQKPKRTKKPKESQKAKKKALKDDAMSWDNDFVEWE